MILEDPKFPGSALLCRSAESALYLALKACGVAREDYLIVPNLGSAALAGALARIGAMPLIIDVDPGSWIIDLDLLEEFLMGHATVNDQDQLILRRDGKRIGAIIGVHLNGNPADLDRLRFIAHRFFLPLIEDASEAAGSLYRSRAIGSFGEAGVITLSHHPAGYDEAASLLLAPEENRLKIAQQAVRDADLHDVPHWVHLDIDNLPLLQQGREHTAQMQQLLLEKLEGLKKLRTQRVLSQAVHHFSTLALETEAAPELHAHLSQNGILTTTLTPPLRDLPAFRGQLYIRREDHASRLFDEVVRIPGVDRMQQEELLRIAETIRAFFMPPAGGMNL